MKSSDAPSSRIIVHARARLRGCELRTRPAFAAAASGRPRPRRYSGPASDATSTSPNTVAAIPRPSLQAGLQQREAHADGGAQRDDDRTIGHPRRSVRAQHRSKPVKVQPRDDRAHRYGDRAERAEKAETDPTWRTDFDGEQLSEHDEAVEERRGVNAVERRPRQHEARHRHRIEPDHRIQLQHEQRDVRADERARDERIGEHAQVLHRRDHAIAPIAPRCTRRTSHPSYTFNVPLDVVAEVISNVHLSSDYNVLGLAAPEIAATRAARPVRDGESRRSSRAAAAPAVLGLRSARRARRASSASRCSASASGRRRRCSSMRSRAIAFSASARSDGRSRLSQRPMKRGSSPAVWALRRSRRSRTCCARRAIKREAVLRRTPGG